MRKTLPLLFTAISLITLVGVSSAQRYLTETFSSVQVTPNVIYGFNYQFLTGAADSTDLTMDVYEPVGDVQSVRPLIIYLHTGSFLPPVINGNPTGSRYDSTTVEMCKQFARRGYVVAAMSYRLGWDPTSSDQDVRTGTLLQAVYRAMQDAKACVRYFREEATVNGNPFHVDTNNIILGGQGTGGYIAMAYATVDKVAEINLPKFLSSTTNPTYGFYALQSYVQQAIWGDFEGYGGNPAYNYPDNHVGYNSDVRFVFNMGGALGDSSWLEAGDVPMVAFHVVGDPFAPFGNGMVYVPTQPPMPVVNVSGSSVVIEKSNYLGNNSCFNTAGFTDPYTQAANAVNGGQDGLYPFFTNPVVQSGPWEWYDSTSLVLFSQFIGYPPAAGTQAYVNGLATNPDMSKAKGLAYIDTIQNYLNPRLVQCLGLLSGVNNLDAESAVISLFPNPSNGDFTVDLREVASTPEYIRIVDLSGRTVRDVRVNDKAAYSFRANELAKGVYMVKVGFEAGEVTKKLVIN